MIHIPINFEFLHVEPTPATPTEPTDTKDLP